MSIDLSSFTKSAPKVKKLNLWLWGLLLIIFILLGFIITGTLSFFHSMPNELFLSGVVGFPVLIWSVLFLCCFFVYKYRKTYHQELNLFQQQRRQELIDKGQQGLYVLGYSLTTEKGRQGNAAALINNSFLITSKPYPTCAAVIPHTSLFFSSEIDINDINGYLASLFNQWKKDIKNQFSDLLSHKNIHVRLFIELGKSVEVDRLKTLWAETIGTVIPYPASIIFDEPGNSNTFIESWLDNEEYSNDLLLILTLHLFDIPTKNEGEFAAWFFLVGEKVNPKLLLHREPTLVKVHRSEQTSSLNQTINNALLWGSTDNTSYDTVWYNGVSSELKNNIVNHFNQIEFKPKNLMNIEGAFGYAGLCSYWLGLSLAIENAFLSKNNQLIVIGKPEVTASAVSCLQQSNRNSNNNRNV